MPGQLLEPAQHPSRVGPLLLTAFEKAGYVFGRNTSLDMSGAGVGYDRLADAANKLVQRKADLIVAFGSEATRAARQATKRTPIIMVNVADAVDEGLVASLSRPGANVTGLSVPLGQIAAKNIELLREINPRLTRVAVLWSPTIALQQQRLVRLERAVEPLGVQIAPVRVATFGTSRRPSPRCARDRTACSSSNSWSGRSSPRLPCSPCSIGSSPRHRIGPSRRGAAFSRTVRAARIVRTCRGLRGQAPAGCALERAARGRTDTL